MPQLPKPKLQQQRTNAFFLSSFDKFQNFFEAPDVLVVFIKFCQAHHPVPVNDDSLRFQQYIGVAAYQELAELRNIFWVSCVMGTFKINQEGLSFAYYHVL